MSNPIHRRSVDRFMAMADGREEVSVLASEYDALESENEALRSQLTDALNRQTCEGGQPYVCHALATARSRLADIEAQNRVMWDVANDREARLAEAVTALRRYGGHEDDCDGTAGYLDPRCTCGFSAALRAADSAEDAPEKCLDCGKTIDLCGCAL